MHPIDQMSLAWVAVVRSCQGTAEGRVGWVGGPEMERGVGGDARARGVERRREKRRETTRGGGREWREMCRERPRQRIEV